MGIKKARKIVNLRLEKKELEKEFFSDPLYFLEDGECYEDELVEMKMMFRSGWSNLDTSGKDLK